jgi:hypothetical protein
VEAGPHRAKVEPFRAFILAVRSEVPLALAGVDKMEMLRLIVVRDALVVVVQLERRPASLCAP